MKKLKKLYGQANADIFEYIEVFYNKRGKPFEHNYKISCGFYERGFSKKMHSFINMSDQAIWRYYAFIMLLNPVRSAAIIFWLINRGV